MPDHIINKEIFEFTYSDTEYAFALQKQMNSGLQYKMQSSINNTLDSFADEVEIIRFDKLEIDLGKIPFEQLEGLLPAKFQIEFKEKLYATIFEKRTFGKDRFTGKQETPADTHNNLELLEIFLLSGSLPWWAERSTEFSLNHLISSLLQNDPAALKSFLYKYIFDEKVITRLFYQSDDEISLQVIELLGVSSFQIVTIENDLKTLIPLLSDRSSIDLSKNIFRLIIKSILIDVFQLSNENKQEQLIEYIREILGYAIDPNVAGTSLASFLSDIDQSAKHFSKEIAPIISASAFSASKNRIDNKDKIYIQNAGLVLISAFLPALFKELKWIEKGNFIDKELQYKAIFLLHYLTTGDTTAPEYTLQLNKILCGLALEEPIPFSVELTEKEKQEADQLLEDIITHWEALKNSLANVLQGSFLIRDGLLSFINNHWLLQIERTGYDILLDQIPWSWKMMQLDWMDTYIETEW